MRLPILEGVIRRRVLVNYRVDPELLARQLPPPFRPKLHNGAAVGGICLIRLEQIHPAFVPLRIGFASENAAHRIAVLWRDERGPHEGVFIPRRDTGSFVNHLAGGRLFPGEHHRATFAVDPAGDGIDLHMRSRDGAVTVRVSRMRSLHTRCLPASRKRPTFSSPGRSATPLLASLTGYTAYG